MESSSLERWPDALRGKLHDFHRDRDSWLNVCPEIFEYFSGNSGVCWILGWKQRSMAGLLAPFTPAISSPLILEKIKILDGPFEHVIKVDVNPTSTMEEAQGRGITSIMYQLTLSAAKELGILDQGYNSLKEDYDQLQYYTYGCHGESYRLASHMRSTIVPLVWMHLSAKKYLLVVDNLRWPIEPRSLTINSGLPLLPWTGSRWLILPTSRDAYNMSKTEDDGYMSLDEDEGAVFLTLFALRRSAEHIFSTIRQESIEYWHHIALECFHYAIAIFAKHSQAAAVTSDELIHQWAVVLPLMTSTISSSSSTKCSYMNRVGRVILEAFQKYSLLQLPFSPASEADEATDTNVQFLQYQHLIAEGGITVGELSNNEKKWISWVGDQGWHVSREWLLSYEEETKGTTALILRGCSQESLILTKLNHFLPQLYILQVLDLSYTLLKSLPSSIGCLLNLRLLSLRGCCDLKTLFISSTTSARDSPKNTCSPLSTLYQLEILDLNGVPLSHLMQDVGTKKSNLIHLDMSHSEIATFPPNFFQDMSNLEELVLVNCSNLVELPTSMAALSNLTTLEITGTKIRYFPQNIFEEMQKLQSLKIIDSNNLISLTRSVSRVQEIKLEGHPNLKSFSLIGAPHIQRLSLRGCRNIEYVELKNLGALEELDLSGTSIKEIPADIPNGTQLRRLLLSGVPCLRRFPWHMLERLPEVFYLDQCTEEIGNHSNEVSQLCVSDPRFFYSFRKSCVDLVRSGRFFQSFYVRVAPCSTNNMRPHHEEEMVDNKLQELVQNQSTYMDVQSSCCTEEIAIVSPITVPLCRTERHVEITRMHQLFSGLYNLLDVTKSISVTYDTSIHNFSVLSVFHDLEECELRWCHKMEVVFYYSSDMRNLRNLHACNLKSLVWLCSHRNSCVFSSLEHLHLEYCPRLETVMPDSATLPCLKTLHILFCYSLKEIFHRVPGQGGTYQLLPNLKMVRLQELPLLQQFNDNDATITAHTWKELHIRGCWSLRRLPCLSDQLKKVKVNGERSWWSKLQWGSPSHRDSYDPKLPPKFASLEERAGVTSYLR